MAKDTATIRVEPVDVYLGGQAVNTVTVVADVANSLDGDYFQITDTAAGIYHVWFNTSGGAAVDPAPGGGSVAIVVALTTGASAATVASAVAVAVNAAAALVNATADGAVVTLKSQQLGAQTLVTGTSGFAVAVVTVGSMVELGYLDGDIELEFEEQIVDITSQQTGTDIIGGIRTGNNLSGFSISLKQNDTVIRDNVIKAFGWDSLTPGGGTEVVGLGETKKFLSTTTQAKRLVLHPTVLAVSDRSRDLMFWQAYLAFDGINFSGENIQLLNFSVRVFPDPGVNTKINKMAFGDWTQSLV